MNTETETQPAIQPEVSPEATYNLLNEIQQYVSFVKSQARRRMLCAEFIEANDHKFMQLGVKPSGYENFIDLDNLTREQVVQALKLFPGKYSKEVTGSQMSYTLVYADGVILRFYNAALPPGCKLIEKVVDVPAQPATMRKVFEIQCGGGNATNS